MKYIVGAKDVFHKTSLRSIMIKVNIVLTRGGVMVQIFITNLHALKPLGFKKKAKLFKTENGFYKLINIQNSQYGDDFYINIGIHPIGLPRLITDQLLIKENSSIFDCILQTRIEPIHMKQNRLLHNVSHETIDIRITFLLFSTGFKCGRLMRI